MTKTVMKASEKSIKNETNEEVGCVWPQILAILAACLGAMNDGALYAWTSPYLVKLTNDKETYNISESEANNLTIIQPVTLMFTGYFFSKLADLIGRKKTMLLMSVPQIVSLLICAYARSIYVFYISRLFAGLASALLWAAITPYIGEVASPNVRGVWGNSLTSSIYAGQFFINVAGSYCHITTTSYIFISVAVAFFVVFCFMPESPFFLIMKNDDESAKKSLRFLTRKTNVESDFSQLKKDVNRQMSESGNWKDVVCIKSNRKALTISLFLRFSQTFSGAAILTQYSQYIIKKSGGNVSPQTASMMYGGIGIILNLLAVTFVVNRFGKKVLLSSSLALCSMVQCLFASYFYIDEFVDNADMTSVSWLPLTCFILFQLSWSFGLAILPTLMMGELFSVSIKSKAMVIMMIVLGGGTFVVNFLFNILSSALGTFAPFTFFTLCTIVSAVMSLYVVPETKGRTLEEIQMDLKGSSKGKQVI